MSRIASRFSRSVDRLFGLCFLLLATVGCTASDAPLPLPTELAAAPFAEGSQPGQLDATFISAVSIAGVGDGRCYKLLRFYPDGLVLYSDLTCFAANTETATLAQEVAQWFKRENREVVRGDYAQRGQRLWLRLVSHDAIHETTFLRLLEGEQCGPNMVLQEPAVQEYAGVPSPLTEPVVAYEQLSGVAAAAGIDSLPCHVAGFQFVRRTYITLTGSDAIYQIQTDVGERCTLRYVAPDGEVWFEAETAVVIADSEGVCAWRWPVGNQPGQGVVTIQIDEISQDFIIHLNAVNE